MGNRRKRIKVLARAVLAFSWIFWSAGAAVAEEGQAPAGAERVAMPDGGEFGFLEKEETRALFRDAFTRLAPGPGYAPQQAVQKAEAALALEPDNTRGQMLYAEVLVRSGRETEGLAFVQKKLGERPAETIYKTSIAQIYFSQKKDDEAYRFLDGEIEKDPGNTELRLFRGDARLFITGEFDKAETEFAALVQQGNPDARLWTSLGFARFQQGKLVSAKEAFGHALKADPVYVEAINNLGWVFHKESRFEDALRQFDRALELRPDYRPAWLGRAYTFRDQGDLRSSLKAYKKLLELDPNFVLVLDMLVLYVRLYLWIIGILLAVGLVWFGRLYLRTVRRDRRKAERAALRR